MALRLSVVSAHAQELGKAASKVFGVHGGTVGRAEDNDWVLPDPDRFISGHHARIEYRQGEYWLADTSSNGTFINDGEEPVSQSGPRALKNGDHVRMGDFELAVTIDASNDFPPDNSAIIAYDGLGSSSAERRVTAEDIGEDLNLDTLLAGDDDSSGGGGSSSRLTPVNAWGQAVESAAISGRRGKSGSEHQKRQTHEAPRQAAQATEAQTAQPSWHLATRRVEPFRNPLKSGAGSAPADAGAPDSAQAGGIQALFRGAGIDPSTLPPAVQAQALQLAGQLLREMVLGMMDVLQTRAEMKNRFRIPDPATPAGQDSEYNPLQFSAGVDEALRKLFEARNKTGSRYIGPLEAVRESFHDIKTHQQALITAMQESLTEFLSHLDPAELQERFDRGLKRGGLLGAATNKMKYWELYSEFFQGLSQRHELPHLFMEEFARSYAEKVAEAGSSRPRGGRNPV